MPSTASATGKAAGAPPPARPSAASPLPSLAKKVLKKQFAPDLEIISYVKSIHDLEADVDPNTVTFDQVESNIVRTGDPNMVEPMIKLIKQARSDGNSLGGVVECVIRNVPVGLGAPVFDKLEAELAKSMMSIPATKGFEIGSGFAGTKLTGREHNDAFRMEGEKVRTTTNNSGGIQGGITNGENIIFRIAFKPTATIMSSQETVSTEKADTELTGRGRHDACVLPRAIPIVEAMAALTLADHALRQRAQCG